MPPKLLRPRRHRGQWVATVPGYGLLPVVHSDQADFAAKRHDCTFEGLSPTRSSKLKAFLDAFGDQPRYVLVQKDKPGRQADEPHEADGYVGVFEITDFIFDPQSQRMQFSYVRRMPERVA